MRSIRRELERRRPKPLAPVKPAASKKPSAPPRGGASEKGRYPLARTSSITSQSLSGSATTHAPPPPRLPRPSSTASAAPPAPPSRSGSSSIGYTSPSTPSSAGHLKPGTQMAIDGKTLVLWLAATVVSATDGEYEVIYEGNQPRENPFSTVRVPLHHVRPRALKPSLPTPPPPSAAPRPTTAEMQPAPRPTRAGKSIHVVRKILSDMEFQARTALPGY
ncbi:hypothetical protein EJB05_12513, partial [Eragrostis curvula]